MKGGLRTTPTTHNGAIVGLCVGGCVGAQKKAKDERKSRSSRSAHFARRLGQKPRRRPDSAHVARVRASASCRWDRGRQDFYWERRQDFYWLRSGPLRPCYALDRSARSMLGRRRVDRDGVSRTGAGLPAGRGIHYWMISTWAPSVSTGSMSDARLNKCPSHRYH